MAVISSAKTRIVTTYMPSAHDVSNVFMLHGSEHLHTPLKRVSITHFLNVYSLRPVPTHDKVNLRVPRTHGRNDLTEKVHALAIHQP